MNKYGFVMEAKEQVQQQKIILCRGCDVPCVEQEYKGYCRNCYCEVLALGWKSALNTYLKVGVREE